MPTPGVRLRLYCEQRWADLGRPRHGMVTALALESGVLRNTITKWFTKSSTPRLDALRDVGSVLQVSRAEMVAAFDGDELVSVDRARLIVREELQAQAAASTPGPSTEQKRGSVARRRSVA